MEDSHLTNAVFEDTLLVRVVAFQTKECISCYWVDYVDMT